MMYCLKLDNRRYLVYLRFII